MPPGMWKSCAPAGSDSPGAWGEQPVLSTGGELPQIHPQLAPSIIQGQLNKPHETRLLLADTETAEDHPKQIIGSNLPCNFAKCIMGTSQFFCHQLTRPIGYQLMLRIG